MRLLSTSALLATSIFASMSKQADDMGPAGFSWPSARAWSSTDDNTNPCGSPDGPSDRTDFPLTNGAVALVINEESYNINLAISYNSDPSTNADFEDLVNYSNFPVLEPGNECYSVPNPASGVKSGQNATLQLMYRSAGSDDSENKTYYACADITYVDLSSFTEEVSCYNYSKSTGVTSSASGVAPTPAATSGSSSSGGSSSGSSGTSSHELSGGAIAGIVIAIVAVVMIAASVLILKRWRKRERVWKARSAKLRMDELKRASKDAKGTTTSVPSAEA